MPSSSLFTHIEAGAHSGAFGNNPFPAPTDAQCKAGNYKLGRVTLHGLNIAVEQPRGTYRTGMNANGKRWSSRMAAHYGYFAGTRGADGDGVDCFIGYYPQSELAYVINQNVAGCFDEHKLMLCFPDQESARRAYTDSYERGWTGLASIVPLSISQLKWWLKNGNMTRPLKPEHLPHEGLEAMTRRTQWSADALPYDQTLDQVLYDIRRSDGGEGLLLDSVSMADILEDSDGTYILDAMVVPKAGLERKMNAMMRVMERAAQEVKPVAVQIDGPFTQRGVANMAAIFELSDGQTVSVYFHNPDVTPKKMAPTDELISWRWLLNKKDITAVVAPERGQDLNVNEVARRIMKLAEKNSAAFVRANGKRAERMQHLADLNAEIAGLEAELKVAQNELEAARIEAEDRAAQAAPVMMSYFSTTKYKDISLDIKNAPVEDVLDAYNSLMERSDTGGFPGSAKWRAGKALADKAEKIAELRPDVLALRKKIADDKRDARLAASSEYAPAPAPAPTTMTEKEAASDAALRALWTEQGVPQARQDELMAQIVAKAQPGASVGPFVIGEDTPPPASTSPLSDALKRGELTAAVALLNSMSLKDMEVALMRSGFNIPGGTKKQTLDYLSPELIDAATKKTDGFGLRPAAKYATGQRVTFKPYPFASGEKGAQVADGEITRVRSFEETTTSGMTGAKFTKILFAYDIRLDSGLVREQIDEADVLGLAGASAGNQGEPDPIVTVDAAYQFTDATDAFKREVADSVDKAEYSTFATAKAMDLKAKALGLSIAWDVGQAVLDSASAEGDEDEDDFDEEDEWDATPEDEGDEVEPILDGDFKGHPFRGNQHKKAGYSSRVAVNSSIKAKRAERSGDAAEAAKAHKDAHDIHRAAAVFATGNTKKYHKKMAKFHERRASAGVMDSALLDAAGAVKTIIGKIKRASKVIGRAMIGGDGKAMVYVGTSGTERVTDAAGQSATWSDDDAADMLDYLVASLAPAKDGAMPISKRNKLIDDFQERQNLLGEGVKAIRKIFNEMADAKREGKDVSTMATAGFAKAGDLLTSGQVTQAQYDEFSALYSEVSGVAATVLAPAPTPTEDLQIKSIQKVAGTNRRSYTSAFGGPGDVVDYLVEFNDGRYPVTVTAREGNKLLATEFAQKERARLAAQRARLLQENQQKEESQPDANIGRKWNARYGVTEIIERKGDRYYTMVDGKTGGAPIILASELESYISLDERKAAEHEQWLKEVAEKEAAEAAEKQAKDADTTYLQSLIDGTTDMFAPDIFERLEPMFAKYENDAAMMAMLERAAQAYGDSAVKAAQAALATA